MPAISNVHLSTILLALLCATSNAKLQLVTLGLLLGVALKGLAENLLPSTRMARLDALIEDAEARFHRAREEHIFSRNFVLGVQAQLRQVYLTRSKLQSELLALGLYTPTAEYWYIIGSLAKRIERCKQQVRAIHYSVLLEVENENQYVGSVER